jgi:ABC-type bacteriocin/lantibiotic exporter with double-glycine peptidase domain
MVSQHAIKVILGGILSIIYFVAMLYYSRPLAYVGLGILVCSFLISGFCTLKKVFIERQKLAINGTLQGILVQMIAGISKLRVCGAEARAFAYWADQFAESKSLQIKAQKYQNVVTTVTAIFPVLSNAVLFSTVVALLSSSLRGGASAISIGSFIAFLAAYFPFSKAIFDMVNILIQMAGAVPLWERAQVILRAPLEWELGKGYVEKLTGEIAVAYVSFRYDKKSPLALHEVSLHVKPGELISIVGPTGCGKSTLVRLLLGFEVPETGTISYNKKELGELDIREVRRQIGTVLQNSTLFAGTIYENIVCGGIYTQEQVEEALQVSGFTRDLETFPMGLHTFVQSGGATFSVGQSQRLLICRAIISKPRILIFDEATSALDNKTQDEITHDIDRLNVTRIVIAHRLSTVRYANRIYVMDGGMIIQTGTFTELSQTDGLFKQMLLRQNL